MSYILMVFKSMASLYRYHKGSNMFWTLISGVVLWSAYITVDGAGDIGPGLWHVNYIKKCEQENHKFKFDIRQKKINRTHDGFDGHIVLDEDFTEGFGVRVDVCKHVDGGCKPCQVLTDDSFVNFVTKYAENNVKTCLQLSGVDPPEFPVAAGEYGLEDYVFDYEELPKDGMYGSFCAMGYMLEGNEEVGCVEVHVEFKEDEEDGDEDY